MHDAGPKTELSHRFQRRARFCKLACIDGVNFALSWMAQEWFYFDCFVYPDMGRALFTDVYDVRESAQARIRMVFCRLNPSFVVMADAWVLLASRSKLD